MKISYRTHPALELLKGNDTSILKFHPEDKITIHQDIVDLAPVLFNQHKTSFNKEIFFVSESFERAMNKSAPKLKIIFDELLDNGEEEICIQCSFIIKSMIGCIHFEKHKNDDVPKCTYFAFDKWGVLMQFLYRPSDRSYFWLSRFIRDGMALNGNNDTLVLEVENFLVYLFLFKKYAQVETKYLPPNKRVKDINCKYVNDTSLGITHLDSRWFTNLVKSDAFKVRGHFRLQPKKKDGEWTKELIWITDFEKKGYTSKARKLSTIDNTQQL